MENLQWINTNNGLRLYTRVVVMEKWPDEKYQKFLSELQSYGCGYWKWRRNFRIREVFVVDDATNPRIGTILKRPIKRKTQDYIELENCGSFDVRTGRALSGEQRYLFPLDDHLVWSAWEPQSLRRRIEAALLGLSLKDVQEYGDLVDPKWCKIRQVLERCRGGAPDRFTNRSVSSLSEWEQRTMSDRRESAKARILRQLPSAVAELRALAEMMEGDAK